MGAALWEAESEPWAHSELLPPTSCRSMLERCIVAPVEQGFVQGQFEGSDEGRCC